MEISCKLVGGYAGLDQELGAINTEEVESKLSKQLKEIIRKINFFDLPAEIPGGEIGSDFEHYLITVSDGNRTHTVSLQKDNEQSLATDLQKLVMLVSGADQ